jgi:drug/metabolite transporter (DMT)-like permease
MSDPASVPGSRPSAWMISAAFSFATMVAITHALGSRCDWLVIALVRALFMLVTTILIVLASGARLAVWRPGTLWIRSLAGSFSLVCSFYASTRLPVGDFITLANTYPLWIVVLTWVGGRKAPSSGDFLRITCAVAGVALIGGPHFSSNNLGAMVALIGSVSTAVAMLGLHKLRHIDARAVVAHFSGVASLIAGAWYLLRGPGSVVLVESSAVSTHANVSPNMLTLGMLLAVGLTGTIGQILLTKAYAAGAPVKVSVLGLTQVVFGFGFDVLAGSRALSPQTLIGAALVVAPTAWLLAHSPAHAASTHEEPEDQDVPDLVSNV